MTADSNVPFPAVACGRCNQSLQGHVLLFDPRVMALPCTVPPLSVAQTPSRTHPAHPGLKQRSLSRRRQPNRYKMQMPSPSPKRLRCKPYASLVHVPIAILCFPAVTISSPPAIMPRKETMSAVPSYAESCRRTSLPVVTEEGKGRRVGSRLLHVRILHLLDATPHDNTRARRHPLRPPC